ncbi:MAG: hypothetical protein QG608_3030 [Actinomycetota bacterium]|nr:hypothetical protein [Actinomycetota bacterium]
MTRIGILLFDGVEELDAVGPWEILGMWAHRHPQEAQVVAFADRPGPIRGAKGLQFLVEHGKDDVGPLDVLVHPGGSGIRPLLKSREHLEWLRSCSEQTGLMTSVCTGALVFAAAGLLLGRPATTHWMSLDLLTEVDPTVVVRYEHRFVDDGNIITSAGVSAGIDMALHLVKRLASPERAKEIRLSVQYDPEPPV